MQIGLLHILASVAAVTAGALIGLAFGAIQEAAARRYLLRQQAGQFNSGWAVVPGSMTRTAYLLVALAGVQLICPLLFTNGCQWWVSGGVVAGYGWALWRKLRQSMAAARAL